MRTVILIVALSLLVLKAFGQNVVSVQVGSADPVEYADFDEAWTYAMGQTEATIKLLSNITRTQTITYRPTVANAQHILDLNNHTIAENTTDNLLYVNKEDAKLTITDSSPTQGGCLYKKKESSVRIHTVLIYQGEIEIAGGKLYCENTIDDSDVEHWHPAVALYCNYGHGAISRISGGILEAVATMSAITVSGYSTVYITGGQIRATVTKYRNAQALVQQRGTAYISGGKLEAFAVGQGIAAYAVSASAWIGTTPETAQYGEVYITGGTFLAQTETNGACAARSDAAISRFGSDIVKVSGKMYISGGSFVTRASDPSATQIFAAVSNGTRLFDEETPHHLIGESLAEMTISGGDFLVDTRDAEGKYVVNQANVDLLRNWGKLNVSGGTFTIYQYNNATGIGCYKNKVTVTGNPVFRIHGAINTRGMVAGPWCHSSYCDADASKNVAEIEIYGGTFNVVSDSTGGSTIAAWAYGGLSTASTSGDAGYAMQAIVKIHNGLFKAIHPTENYAYVLRQEATRTGNYGSAVAQMIVEDGKFQALAGTEADPTPKGRNISSTLDLANLSGGYFVNYNQLAIHINDECQITRLTDTDPQYAEGYRYKVEPGYTTVAKLTAGAVERYYASFGRPFYHAQRYTNATITLLADVDYVGEMLNYNVAPDNASTILDLNGYSVMSNGLHTTFCTVNNDNATLTIKDSRTGGVFGITNAFSYGYALSLRKGHVILESGTIRSENTASGMYGVQVSANDINDAFFEMKGGKIQTFSKGNTYALLARSSSSGASLVTISGGEVEASSTGSYAFAITAAAGGKITVKNNSKVSAVTANSGTQALRAEKEADNEGGVIDVQGGFFSSFTGRVAYRMDGATLNIRGGFYNETSGETFRNQVEDLCIPPYHTLPTTTAEQDNYGAEYVWKVEQLPESGSMLDIVDVDNSAKTLTLNVSDWQVSGWPYTINGTPYAKSLRSDIRTLTIPYTGEPGDNFYILLQDAAGTVVSHNQYVIPKVYTAPSEISSYLPMPLFIKGATLTIGANVTTNSIYVNPDAQLVIYNGVTLNAKEIYLRSNSNSAAQLVNNGTISPYTKAYYTRIVTSKAGYFPFGLPVSSTQALSDIRLSNGTDPKYQTGSGWVLRAYDEATRATNGVSDIGANWTTIDPANTVVGTKGYEIYSGVNYYREYYFPVDMSQLTDKVHLSYTAGKPNDAGWNVIVSPLTHTFTNQVVPEGFVVSWLEDDGTFSQEIPAIIPPMKVFAYQASKAGDLSFSGSSVVHPAPRRMTAVEEQNRIQWIQLDISDANGEGDHTSIYAHPTRYTSSYQTGIDVAKQSLTASRSRIYSTHAYGEMAFAGVSDAILEQGVALTVYSPSAQKLTISMRDNDWLNRMEHVWLVDNQTGARTDLLIDDYAFDAAGTMTGRFTINGQFRSPQISEGVEDVSEERYEGNEARKVIVNGKMYIRVNGNMYDAIGQVVAKY